MSRATGPASLAIAATLAAAVVGCKAIDHAERKGAPPAAPAQSARNTPPPAAKPPAADAHAPGDTHDHSAADDVRRIDIDEARAAVERGEAVFVDVRGDDAFREGHIPGSVSLPGGEVSKRASELPVGKQVITYCA